MDIFERRSFILVGTGNTGRKAEIMFSIVKVVPQLEPKKEHKEFKFERCTFSTNTNPYDLNDWLFLGQVTQFIASKHGSKLNEKNS